MLLIFDSLGATSDQFVQDARTTFETLRDESPKASQVNVWEASAKSLVNTQIKRFESLSWNIKLTRGAREMLRIPVIEAANMEHGINVEQVEKSLDLILDTMKKQDPSQKESRYRNSLDAIRAFYENFCNIPPFCPGKGNGRRKSLS